VVRTWFGQRSSPARQFRVEPRRALVHTRTHAQTHFGQLKGWPETNVAQNHFCQLKGWPKPIFVNLKGGPKPVAQNHICQIFINTRLCISLRIFCIELGISEELRLPITPLLVDRVRRHSWSVPAYSFFLALWLVPVITPKEMIGCLYERL